MGCGSSIPAEASGGVSAAASGGDHGTAKTQEGLFVPLSALRTMKEFSRRGNSACVAHPHSSFDANKTMFVFISHRWLSPSLVPTDAHPDLPGEGSPKLTLVVQACDHLTRSLPEGFETAVWMDWMSLNQDGNPAAELGDSMQGLIGSCDVLLTPIHDPQHREWTYPSAIADWYTQYRAAAWQGADNPDAYWSRPWCRVEATFAAVTPHVEGEARRRKVAALEGRPLGNMLAAGRRPHVLYGTKEMEELRPPLFLPPMLHAQLEKYSADTVLGNLTSQSDRGVIESYVAEAKQCQPLLEVGLVELGGGRVRCTYANGNVYEGECKDGKSHGRGKVTSAGGDVYVGDWMDGQMHGQGKYAFASGNVYDGEYRHGRRHGHGKCSYSDGAAYEGGWKDDKRHGVARYTSAGGEVYEGEYEADKRQGHGKCSYPSGNVYEGAWKDGKMHGHGKVTSTGGDVFEGELKDGRRHGHGRHKFASGAVYEGEYQDGKRHGHGKCLYADGAVYEGDWKDDKRHGAAKDTSAGGEVYVGEYEDDKRQGHGKCSYPSGNVYEGGWQDGKMHGHGKVTTASGEVFEGEWKDGNRCTVVAT